MRTNLDQKYIISLAEHARSGDSDAFAELYMATCQRQYCFAYGYLKDEQRAKEALRDIYVIVLKNIAALKDPNLFLSWLNQISFQVLLGLQKNPEEYTILIDGEEFVIRQVINLPFTEAQVILLRYYKGLKVPDIARLMNLRSNTVRRHLSNGCQKLYQWSKKQKGGDAQ